MKTCLVIALVFAVGYAELDREFKEKILKEIPDQINECAKKEEASKEDYENLMSGKALTRRGAKCLLACIHQKDKILDKNGKLDLDGALGAIEPFKEADADIHAKLKQVFTKCIKSVGDLGDRCETSGKFNDCCNEGYIEICICDITALAVFTGLLTYHYQCGDNLHPPKCWFVSRFS